MIWATAQLSFVMHVPPSVVAFAGDGPLNILLIPIIVKPVFLFGKKMFRTDHSGITHISGSTLYCQALKQDCMEV